MKNRTQGARGPVWADKPVLNRLASLQARVVARGCIALGVAALVAGSAQAQSTAAPAAAAPHTAAAEGPGLVLRTWRSATDLQAWQGDGHWRLALSPISHHFRYSAEHRYVWAFGIERQRPDNWIAGFSFFRNSFGQPSAYAYVGKRFEKMFGEPQLFGQLSAGILYGYKGQYQRKVPLNVNGFSPGALVSAGWQFTPRVAVTAHMLGDAGMMLQLSYDLD